MMRFAYQSRLTVTLVSNHATQSPKRGAGFTLVELLTTLTVAAILLSVAIPSFRNLIRNNRMDSAVGSLSLDFAYARSEAIKRVRPVVLCKTSNRTACSTTANWADGWIVYVDTNGNKALDTGEPILAAREKAAGDIQISATFTNYIAFGSDGSPNNPGNFAVQDSRGATAMKVLCIASTGRVRIANTTDC